MTHAPRRVVPARSGVGPLLQRDYWAVIDRCRCSPSELLDAIGRRFADFAPPDLVVFRRADVHADTLRVGDEMQVRIRGAGVVFVRVAHRDAQSLTLSTLEGHPEAGRITFGAYRNDYRDVIVHIRSRARSSSRSRYLGFLLAGNPMQTTTWTDFVTSVAFTFGAGVLGFVHAETQVIADDPDERDDRPTFRAKGG